MILLANFLLIDPFLRRNCCEAIYSPVVICLMGGEFCIPFLKVNNSHPVLSEIVQYKAI
jgi:hypothetical protein